MFIHCLIRKRKDCTKSLLISKKKKNTLQCDGQILNVVPFGVGVFVGLNEPFDLHLLEFTLTCETGTRGDFVTEDLTDLSDTFLGIFSERV